MQLSDLFGTSATVTAGTLEIDLTELATTHGFDGAIGTITPGQIFAMILMQAKTNTADKTTDPTYGVTVETGYDSLSVRGTASHIASGFTVNVYSPNPNATLDPDSVI
jgi:hypothetical protein